MERSNKLRTTDLLPALKADPGLTNAQRDGLLTWATKNAARLDSLWATNDPVSNAVNKFMKLSPAAKVLVSIAGYGLGRLLVSHLQDNKSDKRRFARYNQNLKVYEIEQ